MAEEYPPLFERVEIDGLKVVKDEVYTSPLSKHLGRLVPIHGIRELTLEDDTTTLGCRDCEFAGTLGQVRQHRKAEHGVSLGGYTARKSAGPASSADDAAAAGLTAAPVTVPASALSMTLYDLLALAGHVDDWEQVLATMEDRLEVRTAERDDARDRARKAEKELETIRKRGAKLLGLELVEEN